MGLLASLHLGVAFEMGRKKQHGVGRFNVVLCGFDHTKLVGFFHIPAPCLWCFLCGFSWSIQSIHAPSGNQTTSLAGKSPVNGCLTGKPSIPSGNVKIAIENGHL